MDEFRIHTRGLVINEVSVIMVKINGVYLYNKKAVAVLNAVNLQEKLTEKYYICAEVEVTDSNDFYGGRAYQLCGRPFIMSFDEIKRCSEVILPCQKCAFYSITKDFESDCAVCVCMFKQFEAPNNNVLCFRPYCKKIHKGCWKLTEVNSEQVALQICDYLSTSEVSLCGINNANAIFIKEREFQKHYLNQNQFQTFVFNATESVVFVSEYLYFLDSKIQADSRDKKFIRNMQPRVYRIDETFSYECYCYLNAVNIVPYNAFLLPNGKAIFQHCENVILYDNGDIYFFELVM